MIQFTDKVREGIVDGKSYIVLKGDLVSGFTFIGPFTYKEALDASFGVHDTLLERLFAPEEVDL